MAISLSVDFIFFFTYVSGVQLYADVGEVAEFVGAEEDRILRRNKIKNSVGLMKVFIHGGLTTDI